MEKTFKKIKVGIGLAALATLFAFNLHHAVVYHYGVLNLNFSQNWQVYAQTNSAGAGGDSHPGGGDSHPGGGTPPGSGTPCICPDVANACISTYFRHREPKWEPHQVEGYFQVNSYVHIPLLNRDVRIGSFTINGGATLRVPACVNSTNEICRRDHVNQDARL